MLTFGSVCIAWILCWAGGQTRGFAANIEVFFESTQASSPCLGNVTSMPATSRIDCAARASVSNAWKSFSYVNESCIVSSSPGCTVSGAISLFRKRGSVLESVAPIEVPQSYGFEQSVGLRRFWVFQQRKTGLVSFAKNWTDYEKGFGDSTDFWSGLTAISNMTNSYPGRTLRVEMVTFDGIYYATEFSNFSVANTSTNYTLSYINYLTSASNTSCDSLWLHRGMKFTTIDRDNDLAPYQCSQSSGGAGFWFKSCLYMNPNGLYSSTNQSGSIIYMSNMCVLNYRTLRETRMMVQV